MCTVSLLTSCATEEPEIPVLAELNPTGFSWESTCLPYLLSMNPHNLLTAASHANHTPVKVLLYRVNAISLTLRGPQILGPYNAEGVSTCLRYRHP